MPGLAAKPILDIDVIVDGAEMSAAVAALGSAGYVHRGDLGVVDREAFHAPDANPRRNVYVCRAGTLNVRNHLAVRDVLRVREDLRDEYGAVKLALAGARHGHRYLHRSKVCGSPEGPRGVRPHLDECLQILRLNDPAA
nr:GrpB family protein [Paenarthrobacter ureafaciens]